MSHYLKLLLDAVFGRRRFLNEIIWCYRGGGTPKYDFARRHDIILRYSKGSTVTFNVDDVRIPYSDASKERLEYTARSFRPQAGSMTPTVSTPKVNTLKIGGKCNQSCHQLRNGLVTPLRNR